METKELLRNEDKLLSSNKPELNTALKKNHRVETNYIHHATSDNTRRAYQSDIRHFETWGGFLPSSQSQIINYLEHFAGSLNPSTMVRRLTAIKLWHKAQGFDDPTVHPAVRKTLTGIKRVHGKPKIKRTLSLSMN